ncbi:MAG TPA: hypothetical protein VMW31_00530 [Devosiaceae bacterium]|nr:hypothetical protein [Devosiaceae bacterium]
MNNLVLGSSRPAVLAVLAAVALSGCGIGSLMGGSGDAGLANTTATQSEIAQAAPSALPAIARECPPIKVLAGGEVFSVYAAGRQGDAQGLRYQAVIDQESRNCVVSDGLITVRMGVVGRVLAGPQGLSGTANVPVRFAVVRDELTVFSQKYDLPISVTPPSQSEEFIKVVENVAIPYLGGENIILWIGFDG